MYFVDEMGENNGNTQELLHNNVANTLHQCIVYIAYIYKFLHYKNSPSKIEGGPLVRGRMKPLTVYRLRFTVLSPNGAI